MTAAHGPWVDLHAHAGRCFLAGLPDDDPVAALLGGHDTERAIGMAERAGLAAVGLATVADLRVLGLTPDGGLRAVREFEPRESHDDNARQLAGIGRIVSRLGVSVVRVAEDVRVAHRTGAVAVLLACEGADFVEDDLSALAGAHAAGLRSVVLVHYTQNRFGDLQTEPAHHGGLSASGRELVTEMNRLGMIVDLSHATEATTLDALDVSADPVMISHTHLRRPGGDHPRLISANHARAVADAGGLIGAWPAGVTSETFTNYVDEIARLAEVVGVDHVAIGTDLDANYRPVMTSHDEFADIASALAARGFTDPDVDRVLGGNAVRLIETVCG